MIIPHDYKGVGGYGSAFDGDNSLIIQKSTQPTYKQWLRDQQFGHYVCLKCELELGSNILDIMYEDNMIKITRSGAYLCPLCDYMVLQWWTQEDGVVFFE